MLRCDAFWQAAEVTCAFHDGERKIPEQDVGRHLRAIEHVPPYDFCEWRQLRGLLFPYGGTCGDREHPFDDVGIVNGVKPFN